MCTYMHKHTNQNVYELHPAQQNSLLRQSYLTPASHYSANVHVISSDIFWSAWMNYVRAGCCLTQEIAT